MEKVNARNIIGIAFQLLEQYPVSTDIETVPLPTSGAYIDVGTY